jgi:hypothetical protein
MMHKRIASSSRRHAFQQNTTNSFSLVPPEPVGPGEQEAASPRGGALPSEQQPFFPSVPN